MENLLELIKRPLSRDIAAILGITYPTFRAKVVATRKDSKAMGANYQKGFEKNQLIDLACQGLEGRIKELKALKS